RWQRQRPTAKLASDQAAAPWQPPMLEQLVERTWHVRRFASHDCPTRCNGIQDRRSSAVPYVSRLVMCGNLKARGGVVLDAAIALLARVAMRTSETPRYRPSIAKIPKKFAFTRSVPGSIQEETPISRGAAMANGQLGQVLRQIRRLIGGPAAEAV